MLDERVEVRQARYRPLVDQLYQWMELHRRQIIASSATAKSLDCRLKRWGALTYFLDNEQLPIDNNLAHDQIRLIAIGRKN